jgi:hypothetical protein
MVAKVQLASLRLHVRGYGIIPKALPSDVNYQTPDAHV